MPLKREDWNLLAIAAAGGEAVDPVQLQKVLFLLGREMHGEVGRDFYRFQPYNYGPFDKRVYTDADGLAALGYVNLSRGRLTTYAATPDGLEHAELIRQSAPAAWIYLKKVMAWARGLTFQQLVRAIYKAYPDTRAKSIFQS